MKKSKKIIQSLTELIRITFSDRENYNYVANLGPVSDQIAIEIKAKYNLDITGYICTIDNYAIKHSFFQHGSEIQEAKRGQLPITIDTITIIPKILKTPDRIYYGQKNKIGRDIIIFEKVIGSRIICVEEIRTKSKELAFQTIYIKKAR